MATIAGRWIAAWADGWAGHDPDRVAEGYAPHAAHRSHPFREPGDPRAYAEWAFVDEQAVEVWFSEPQSESDSRAAVEWWAISRSADGTETTLAGVALLMFDSGGLVVEQRDYWASEPGARRPPDGWGPVAVHRRS